MTGYAQRPDKQIRFDFLLMHTVTTATFLPLLVRTPWIPREAVARMLEWVGWLDLLIYAEVGAPELRPQLLKTYKPSQPSDWDRIFERACEYEDDGHTAKFIRGLKIGSIVTSKYKDRKEFRLKTDEEFLQLAHASQYSRCLPCTNMERRTPIVPFTFFLRAHLLTLN